MTSCNTNVHHYTGLGIDGIYTHLLVSDDSNDGDWSKISNRIYLYMSYN